MYFIQKKIHYGPWKSLITAVQTDNAPPQRDGIKHLEAT